MSKQRNAMEVLEYLTSPQQGLRKNEDCRRSNLQTPIQNKEVIDIQFDSDTECFKLDQQNNSNDKKQKLPGISECKNEQLDQSQGSSPSKCVSSSALDENKIQLEIKDDSKLNMIVRSNTPKVQEDLIGCSHDGQDYNKKHQIQTPRNKKRKLDPFLVFHFAYKFIVFIKQCSSNYQFKELTSKHFDIIDDKTMDYKYFRNRSFFLKDQPTKIQIKDQKNKQLMSKVGFTYLRLIKYLQKLQKKCIIYPDNKFNQVWDSFILFLLIVNIFYIPMKIAFENNDDYYISYGLLIILEEIPQWAFLMDLLLNFNTAYFEKGSLVNDSDKMIKHYLNNGFIADFIVIAPFFVSLMLNIPYLDSVLILRFHKMISITNQFIDTLNLREDKMAYFDLFKLIFLILFVAHFTGCLFVIVAHVQSDINESWMGVNDLLNLYWLDQYVVAFYFSVITMITVGYGDISPVNTMEYIYVIIITLISCGVFAYSVNQIGSIFQSIFSRTKIFKCKMSLLAHYMNKRKIDHSLQVRIRKYFEYLQHEHFEDEETANQILQNLPKSLLDEAYNSIYYQILIGNDVFSKNFSKSFLKSLASKMKEQRISNEEIIFEENKIIDKIFFLEIGEVEIYQHNTEKKIIGLQKVQKNKEFSFVNFIDGKKAEFGARALDVSNILYIEKQDFMDSLKEFPLDNEIYCLIKDNLEIFQSSQKQVETKCIYCGNLSHYKSLSCPQLHYNPNKIIMMKRYFKFDLARKQEDRDKDFQRRELQFGNTLAYTPQLQELTINFKVQNWINDTSPNKETEAELLSFIEQIKDSHRSLPTIGVNHCKSIPINLQGDEYDQDEVILKSAGDLKSVMDQQEPDNVSMISNSSIKLRPENKKPTYTMRNSSQQNTISIFGQANHKQINKIQEYEKQGSVYSSQENNNAKKLQLEKYMQKESKKVSQKDQEYNSKRFHCIDNFDRVQDFYIYFPWYNVEKVLNQLEIIQEKMAKKIQKRQESSINIVKCPSNKKEEVGQGISKLFNDMQERDPSNFSPLKGRRSRMTQNQRQSSTNEEDFPKRKKQSEEIQLQYKGNLKQSVELNDQQSKERSQNNNSNAYFSSSNFKL